MKNVDSVFTTYLLFAIEKPLKEKRKQKDMIKQLNYNTAQ